MNNKKSSVRNLGRNFSGNTPVQQRNKFLAMGAVALLTGTIATAMSACDGHSTLGVPIPGKNDGGTSPTGGSGGQSTGGFGGEGAKAGSGGVGGKGGSAGFGGEGAHAGEGGAGGFGGEGGSAGTGGLGGQGGVAGSGGQGGVAGSGGEAGAGGQTGNCPTAFDDSISSQYIYLGTPTSVGGYDFIYQGESGTGSIIDIECSSNNAVVGTYDCALYSITTITAPDKDIDIQVHAKTAGDTRVSITVY